MHTRPFASASIEPLEARIAPALLIHGANLLGGSGNPSSGETSVGDHAVTLVKVLSGQAIVWYDATGNGSIAAISFGPNTSLDITGNVEGDLLGNLTADGEISDSDSDPANGNDGAKLLANNLIGLKTSPLSGDKGDVGNIITGGSIAGLSISGALVGAYAGDGAFRTESDVLSGVQVTSILDTAGPYALDIDSVTPGAQTTFTFTQAGSEFRPGASIAGAKIASAPALQLFAGSGNPTGAIFAGPGPAGGNITGITIDAAYVPAGSPLNTPSYTLLAGDGADGKSGGAGGSIDRIIEKTSFGPVILTGGQGGAGNGGAGGVGGGVSNLDLQSNSARYLVTAGDGGDGAPAGDGGKLSNNNFTNRTPVSGIILAGDFTGDGEDDVLVVDAATGQMIVSTRGDYDPNTIGNQGNGTDFRQIVQFYTPGGSAVVLIDPSGVNPSDAAAVDLNGDNKLDIVVAYKTSNSLGVFINQGGGTFYDANILPAGGYAAANLPLGAAPAKIAVSGSVVAFADNTNGKGVLRYGVIQAGATAEEYSIETSTGSNEFSQPVADLVVTGGEYYAGFANGVLSRLETAALDAKKPFTVFTTGIAITGGITDLEVDSTGKRLLALSSTARTVDLFDTANSTLTPLQTIALPPVGKPLVAHFFHDADDDTDDEIRVLSGLPAGSRLSTFSPGAGDGNPLTFEPFAPGATFTSTTVVKNFAPVYDDAAPTGEDLIGDATLAGNMSTFSFTPDLIASADYALPFASKIIEARGGAGGTGLNLNAGKLLGKGGGGGSILGINADANEIKLFAGDGGASGSGPAGAGGSVVNPSTFLTASGGSVVPTLLADVVLIVEAGDGSAPAGPEAKTAAGGAGGSLTGLSITLESGDITLTTGRGGDGFGGNGGNGGNFSGVQTLARDGSLTVSTGLGGNATGATGSGGAGGGIVNYRHELALEPDAELLEKDYAVTLSTGVGGTAVNGAGGAGGAISGALLRLDPSDRTYNDNSVNPPLVDSGKDNTVRVSVQTGSGGEGATGGAGGTIRDFSSHTVFDQLDRNKAIRLNYVTMNLTAGDGGRGLAGNGGAGGGLLFSKPVSGVTDWDPDSGQTSEPFLAAAGAGGQGTLKGGAGGGIAGLTVQNAPFTDGSSITSTHLFGATLIAGAGGAGGTVEGGAGGSITKGLIAVEGGALSVFAGQGGNGGAGKGGAGGAVNSSTFGVVISFAPVGLEVQAGAGGDGTLGGGAGGAVSTLQVNLPQSNDGLAAFLLAGHGGAANSLNGLGGKGGDVSGITHNKDVNSAINLIAAGYGGANPLGKAGAGGNVAGIKTVGFLGRPSDGVSRLGVFDQLETSPGNFIEIPQGVFAGQGGDGVTDGANGSVSNVTARQIAAIAAFNSSTFAFAPAAKVSSVKAAVIGYDLLGDGVFNSTVGSNSPSLSKPIDGFILAAALQQVSVLPPASFLFTA